MSKSFNINVQDITINATTVNNEDFICLTDMVKGKGDEARAADVIKNWIRTRGTIEFLGTWESLYNPNFKVVEFDHFKKEAGLPSFVMSVSNWVEKTGAIGIFSKSGKTGGTYAHRDIAFEFGGAISAVFKLYLIKEYQRLKELESNAHNIEWNVKRVLTKANYQIHTAAVKEYRVPKENLPKDKEGIVYADEAEILNYAVWGFTSKAWREENQKLALQGLNLRDLASINELVVISNLESVNAVMLGAGVDRNTRLRELRLIAQSQLAALNKVDFVKSYKRQVNGSFTEPESKQSEVGDFDKKLKGLLDVPPPKRDK